MPSPVALAGLPAFLAELGTVRAEAIERATAGHATRAATAVSVRVDLMLLEALARSFLERVGRPRLVRDLHRVLGLPSDLADGIDVFAEGAPGGERLATLLGAAPWLREGSRALEQAAQALAGHHDKQTHGKFYTPRAVIDHVIGATVAHVLETTPIDDVRVLEPACGAGDFVVAAFERLVAARVVAGEPPAEAARRVLARNLYAVDSDPVAVAVTRLRLVARLLDELVPGEPISLNHVLQENALWDGIEPPDFGVTLDLPFVAPSGREAPTLEGGTGLLAATGPFHVVIGNPPYGGELDAASKAWLRKRYSLASGRIETAALFLERCIELGAPGGALGLVMPHSFSRSGGYRAAREMLGARMSLDTLVDLGATFPGVQFNTMVFTATREPRTRNVTLHEARAAEIVQTARVPRRFLLGRDTLAMHVAQQDVALWRRIEAEGRPLAALVSNERGYNLPERRSRLAPPRARKERALPVVQGRDIEPFRMVDPTSLPTVDAAMPGLPPSLDAYELAIQNVSNVIEATLVAPGTLPLDTVNLLRLGVDGVERDYLLAVLNSSIVGAYFRDLVINRATLTVHLDEPTLGGLPIVLPPEETQRAIAVRVRALLGLDGQAAEGDARAALATEVDAEIDRLYGITPEVASRLYG